MAHVTLRVKRLCSGQIKCPLTGIAIPDDRFIEVTYSRVLMSYVNKGKLEKEDPDKPAEKAAAKAKPAAAPSAVAGTKSGT